MSTDNLNVSRLANLSPSPTSTLPEVPPSPHKYALGEVYTPVIVGRFKNIDKYILMDDGSSKTLVDEETARLYGNIRQLSSPTNLTWMNDVKMPTLGAVDIDFSIKGHVFRLKNVEICKKIPYNCSFVIGRDFQLAEPCRFNIFTGLAKFYRRNFSVFGIEVPSQESSPVMFVQLSRQVTIPARSGMDVAGHLRNTAATMSRQLEDIDYTLEATNVFKHKTGLHLAKTLLSGSTVKQDNGEVSCRILNPTERPIKVHKHTRLAYLSPTDIVVEDPFSQHGLSDDAVLSLQDQWRTILSAHQIVQRGSDDLVDSASSADHSSPPE